MRPTRQAATASGTNSCGPEPPRPRPGGGAAPAGLAAICHLAALSPPSTRPGRPAEAPRKSGRKSAHWVACRGIRRGSRWSRGEGTTDGKAAGKGPKTRTAGSGALGGRVNPRGGLARCGSKGSPRETLFVTILSETKVASACGDDTCRVRVSLGGVRFETGYESAEAVCSERLGGRRRPKGHQASCRGSRRWPARRAAATSARHEPRPSRPPPALSSLRGWADAAQIRPFPTRNDIDCRFHHVGFPTPTCRSLSASRRFAD